MGKISTMQKLFGLCMLLSLFPLAIGGYAVTSLQKLTYDLSTLYNVHIVFDDNNGMTSFDKLVKRFQQRVYIMKM